MPTRQSGTWAPQRVRGAVRILSSPAPLPTTRATTIQPVTWRVTRSGLADLTAAQQRDADKATSSLVSWLDYLEQHGERAGVRDLTDDADRLYDLLKVTKPSTAKRHLLMAARLRKFVDSIPSAEFAALTRVLNPKLIYEWLISLKQQDCGAHTLNAALAMVKWTSVHFIITQEVTSSMPLYKLAADWRQSKHKLPNQAQAFPKHVVEWLESMVLNGEQCDVSRLLCGRYRLLIGASLRGDDLRRTTPLSLEWLEHNGERRALLGMAPSTKTGPRQWICSTLGTSPQGDGWLEATLSLLRQAHGPNWSSDDHLGKAAASNACWASSPPVLAKDIVHLRELLAQHGFAADLCAA
eukprot:6492323-Amphidinium_carterae.1